MGLDGDSLSDMRTGSRADGVQGGRPGSGGRAPRRACRPDSLGLRVVLCPDGLELVQVVRAQDGPVSREVVEVVHDHSHEEVDDL